MLPGGKDFNDFIPSELSTIFSKLIDNFSMVVDSTPEVTYLSLALSTNQPWPVIPPDVLILEGLVAKIKRSIPPALRGRRFRSPRRLRSSRTSSRANLTSPSTLKRTRRGKSRQSAALTTASSVSEISSAVYWEPGLSAVHFARHSVR